ncbi:Variant surface glycoprotein [Trypanosoma congolense IL3000]|uniref:Variant surface glycoprotein n=1 Tax=Trypanosoma congolense (strain IL3000) TaxID=1068625 RepID=F9WBM7_TRYCI|nr:Variant surface glycoprotein [Trypanosoma congolense IL3000]
MMKMMNWMVMMVFFGVAESADEKNHNGPQHSALCGLLKIAVHKWIELKSSGSDGPLKKALGRTIFGDDSGEDLQKLKSEAFPKVYNGVKESSLSRLLWCGGPYDEESRKSWTKQPRWPGYSATHDLVCLCTVGAGGWPLYNNEKEKLCGLERNALLATEKQGWGTGGATREGEKQIGATWTGITKKCLESDGKGGDVQDALKLFIDKLNCTGASNHGNKCKLGEGESKEFPCTGNQKVCVMYHNSTDATEHKPWWVDLEEAINKDEAEQEQNKRESEKRKKEETQSQHHTNKKENSQPQQTPRVAPAKSTIHDKQDGEQDDTQNMSSPIETIEDKSGTQLFSPCSCFLGALLFI